MKIGKLIIEFRRAGGPKLVEEVFNALTDPEGEARAVIAKMARSAAKDFLDKIEQNFLDGVTAELEKRKAASLAELGSSAPTATAHTDPTPEHVFSLQTVEAGVKAVCRCAWESTVHAFEETAAAAGKSHVTLMTIKEAGK